MENLKGSSDTWKINWGGKVNIQLIGIPEKENKVEKNK